MSLLWVAISMLVGDRVKFFALIFGVAFATLLMAQQSSFAVGLLSLSGNFVRDVREADLWVMRPGTVSAGSALPMASNELLRVRGVAGVEWAMPLFNGNALVRIADGSSLAVNILGVDNNSLIGTPQTLLMGAFDDLRGPEAVFLNRTAYQRLFPGEPERLGATLELNDRRAVVAGIVQSSPRFGGDNLVYTRYSNAVRYVPSGRNTLSFVVVKAQAGVAPTELARRITQATGMKAIPRLAFAQENVDQIIKEGGIVQGFGLVVFLGAIVGAVIVGLTLSLFIRDNIKQLGALKAIGVRNTVLTAMVLTQSLFAGLIGYGLGIGFTAWLLTALAGAVSSFSTFYLPWQVMAATAAAVLVMIVGAALFSVRRVLTTDAAEVFR
jgi:putative ABC transport system permease protein